MPQVLLAIYWQVFALSRAFDVTDIQCNIRTGNYRHGMIFWAASVDMPTHSDDIFFPIPPMVTDAHKLFTSCSYDYNSRVYEYHCCLRARTPIITSFAIDMKSNFKDSSNQQSTVQALQAFDHFIPRTSTAASQKKALARYVFEYDRRTFLRSLSALMACVYCLVLSSHSCFGAPVRTWHATRFSVSYTKYQDGVYMSMCWYEIHFFFSERNVFLLGQPVYSRALGCVARRGAACTPRRKCEPWPRSVASALGLQSREF